ncbi:type VII secretion integral membrane protein EccD [Nocardioides sp.]|uniref:type VII secretion integral membrane protein EccD n=1 Tax=Nocardioides sp. TaxID=35761 RepID=UPI002B273351|nr:type VII secretion integral membrane protein EccD [Nocardioides sp.]
MSQAHAQASGLIRVTVASSTRRVDLVLPGSIPVVELLPELARSVGLLDAATVYGGYRLTTSDGRRLEADAGLTLQGVDDGHVITVSAGVDDLPPPVYDDVVEAMTDVVEHDLLPWDPASGRRTALWAASLLMALGAAALFLQADQRVAGVAAAVLAGVLTTAAIVLSRAQSEPEAAVTVAWMGVGYAAVSGLLISDLSLPAPEDDYARALLGAGVGTALVGAACLVGLGIGRALLVPAVVVGAVAALTGALALTTDLSPAVVLTVVLTLLVMMGSIFPWLALGATSTSVEALYSAADITAERDDLDPVRVAANARLAHEILVAISASVGILLVLVAPPAVTRGLDGTLLVVVACAIVMLRTRQYRTGSEVLVGLASGVLGLVSMTVALLVAWPEWRPATAVVLAVAGGVLLVSTLSPSAPSLRRGRLGDVLETIALLSLLPLLVLASGLFDKING